MPLGRLKGDLGTLLERLEAVAGYARVVHEEVLATLVRSDEAVAFIIAEPLYRSLGHIWSPPFVLLGLHCNKNAAPLVEGGASFTIKPTSSTTFLTIPRARPEPRRARRFVFVVGGKRRGPLASVVRNLGPLAHRRTSENSTSTHWGE